MSALIRPRGTLPARVYWVRRSLMLGLVFVLVFGVGRVFSGGGDGEGRKPVAQTAASSSNPTPTPQAKPFIGPQAFVPAGGKATGDQPGVRPGQTKPVQPSSPLPMPTTDCDPDEITVTPVLAAARAGQDVQIPLDVTGTASACRFEVSSETLALKVTHDGERVWSTQQCSDAIRKQTIAVRSSSTTRITVTWNGGYPDEACAAIEKWAMPDTYGVEAAVIGSEPSDGTFRLTLPPRPVVTRSASPEPEPEPEPRSGVQGKQTKCGGDIASNSC